MSSATDCGRDQKKPIILLVQHLARQQTAGKKREETVSYTAHLPEKHKNKIQQQRNTRIRRKDKVHDKRRGKGKGKEKEKIDDDDDYYDNNKSDTQHRSDYTAASLA